MPRIQRSAECIEVEVKGTIRKAIAKKVSQGIKVQKTKRTNLDNEQRTRTIMFHPELVNSLIPEFDGETILVREFIERVETNGSIYEWTAQQHFLYATSRLRGIPKLWWEASCNGIMDYVVFKGNLTRKFEKAIDPVKAHFTLLKVKRNNEESLIKFAYRINLMAKNNGLDEEAAVKYIVNASVDEQVYTMISTTQFKNLEQLTDKLQYCEVMVMMKNMDVSNKTEESSKVRTSSLPKTVLRCYSCQEIGHRAAYCPNKIKLEVQQKIETLQPRAAKFCGYCKMTNHTEEKCYRKERVQGQRQETLNVEEIIMDKEEISTISPALGMDMKTKIQLIIGNKVVTRQALWDTGSAVSMVNYSSVPSGVALSICLKKLNGVNNTDIKVKGSVTANVIINGELLGIKLIVVEDGTFNCECLIGRDFMESNNLKMNIMDRYEKVLLTGGSVEEKFDKELMKEVFSDEEVCVLNEVLEIKEQWDIDIGDTQETKDKEKVIKNIFMDNYVLREKPKKPIVEEVVKIKLKSDKTFHVTPRRHSMPVQKELNKMVDELIQKEIIRESESEYTSRVVMTQKKNGEYRMCINYRPLNKIVERNYFPMPIIEDQLIKIKGRKYFTGLDLKNGFYHVSIEEESKKFTSFVTESGQYEFNKLPFGFANSPALFARYINKVLKKLVVEGKIVVFVDDILVATETIEEHIVLLKELFIILSDNHVMLQMKKCEFLKTHIEFVGYEITKDEIRPSDRHVEAVKKYPVPINEKALQRFLGFISYFRKFIANFSQKAYCLYELMKKDNEYKFERIHLKAFTELKECLIIKPVLCIYSHMAETEVHTDASSRGFGGILMQKQEEDIQ